MCAIALLLGVLTVAAMAAVGIPLVLLACGLPRLPAGR